MVQLKYQLQISGMCSSSLNRTMKELIKRWCWYSVCPVSDIHTAIPGLITAVLRARSIHHFNKDPENLPYNTDLPVLLGVLSIGT